MKNTKEYLKKILAIFIFTILVTNFSSHIVSAEPSYNLLIKFEKFDEITKTKDGTKLEELVFDVWEMNEDYPKKDIQDKINELNKLSNTELDKKFNKGFEKTAKIVDDSVELTNMGKGIYFIRERASENRSTYLAPLIIKITGEGPNIEIYGKPTQETPGPTGKIKIEKQSTSGKKLEGVQFKLYQLVNNKKSSIPLVSNGNEYRYNELGKELVLETNSDGEIHVTNLPFGEYVLDEVKPLPGYKPLNKSIEINVNKVKPIYVRIINEMDTPKGSMKFLKISDDKKKTPLQGAEFEIYTLLDGKYTRYGDITLVSDKDGKFEVKDLPYGKYYLKETKAPEGYVLLTDYLEFEINDNSGVKEITIIKNKAKPITPPKTGDRGIAVYLILGLAGLSLYLLSKKKNVFN